MKKKSLVGYTYQDCIPELKMRPVEANGIIKGFESCSINMVLLDREMLPKTKKIRITIEEL